VPSWGDLIDFWVRNHYKHGTSRGRQEILVITNDERKPDIKTGDFKGVSRHKEERGKKYFNLQGGGSVGLCDGDDPVGAEQILGDGVPSFDL